MPEVALLEKKLGNLQSWVIGGVCFILAFALTFTAWGAYQAHKLSDNRSELAVVATTTHTALCSLRSDLQRRVDASKAFLKEHPEGIPGISSAEIQRSTDSQEQTVKALDILKC